MRAMNSASVDLIATDPPFNKGRDFHATPDSTIKNASFQDRWSWKEDVHPEWIKEIKDTHPELMHSIEVSRYLYGDDMGAFLCFMAVRLLAMHRLLKDTGSIYLHCDPTASHYLKMIMDAIFGKENFQNEILWCYTNGGATKRRYSRKHDVILFYSKTDNYIFNTPRIPYTSLMSKDPKHQHKFHKDGKIMMDWWADISPLNPMANERTKYPTQKPLALYERIIKASSNPGDMVLDPFAGCATTCVAAERVNRNWVGIDLWDGAKKMVVDRMEKEAWLFSEGKTTPYKNRRILYRKDPPERTDDGLNAVPELKTPKSKIMPVKLTGRRKEVAKQDLIETEGFCCQGCGWVPHDEHFLQLDHKAPKGDGGSDDPTNLTLLCSKCNLTKGEDNTLTKLRKINKKKGYMQNESNLVNYRRR